MNTAEWTEARERWGPYWEGIHKKVCSSDTCPGITGCSLAFQLAVLEENGRLEDLYLELLSQRPTQLTLRRVLEAAHDIEAELGRPEAADLDKLGPDNAVRRFWAAVDAVE